MTREGIVTRSADSLSKIEFVSVARRSTIVGIIVLTLGVSILTAVILVDEMAGFAGGATIRVGEACIALFDSTSEKGKLGKEK